MAEIYFTREHEWVRLEDGVGVVGISEHAAHELGDVTFVELPRVGSVLNQFDLLGSIESVKAASDIYAPLTGTVVRVNEALENAPELVNESAQDRGWMVWLRISDPTELERLMTEEQYADYLKSL